MLVYLLVFRAAALLRAVVKESSPYTELWWTSYTLKQ